MLRLIENGLGFHRSILVLTMKTYVDSFICNACSKNCMACTNKGNDKNVMLEKLEESQLAGMKDKMVPFIDYPPDTLCLTRV